MKKILPSLFITYFIFLSFGLLALEMNEEELIKGRKALFKQNYGIAKFFHFIAHILLKIFSKYENEFIVLESGRMEEVGNKDSS